MEIKGFKEVTEAKMKDGAEEIAKAKKSLKVILDKLNKLDYQRNPELAKVYNMSDEASEWCHGARGEVKKWADKALKEKDYSELPEAELKFISKNSDMIELSMTINTYDVRAITSAIETVL